PAASRAMATMVSVVASFEFGLKRTMCTIISDLVDAAGDAPSWYGGHPRMVHGRAGASCVPQRLRCHAAGRSDRPRAVRQSMTEDAPPHIPSPHGLHAAAGLAAAGRAP